MAVHHSQFEPGKAHSLVFEFADQLPKEGDLTGPQSDFLRWIDQALFADLGTAFDYTFDRSSDDERTAWSVFYNAVEATEKLLELYKTTPALFQKIASQLSFLPCLMSWHPDAERFNRQFLADSQLGTRSMYGDLRNNPHHLAQQSSPVRYAYAIIETIELTAETYQERLPLWAETYGYGVKHPIALQTFKDAAMRLGWDDAKWKKESPKYRGAYRILPEWTRSLSKLRRPFTEYHVVDYWRTGKEIIIEELPDFHLRTEWQSYHKRRYKGGAKAGVIQHAIFKDILAALKTIAGANKTKSAARCKSS